MMDTTTNNTDSQTEKKPEGGSEWELSEAIKLMGEATASGDPEQIATAMRRHAEALSNSAATVLIPTLKTTLESVLRTEIGKLAMRIDNSDRERLDGRVELREHIDDRFDNYGKELDHFRTEAHAAWEETGIRLKKMQGQVDTLADDLSGLRASHEAQDARHEAQIEELGTRLDHKRERLDHVERELAVMRGPELPPEQRQRYIVILLKMIAEWEAAHPDDLA